MFWCLIIILVSVVHAYVPICTDSDCDGVTAHCPPMWSALETNGANESMYECRQITPAAEPPSGWVYTSTVFSEQYYTDNVTTHSTPSHKISRFDLDAYKIMQLMELQSQECSCRDNSCQDECRYTEILLSSSFVSETTVLSIQAFSPAHAYATENWTPKYWKIMVKNHAGEILYHDEGDFELLVAAGEFHIFLTLHYTQFYMDYAKERAVINTNELPVELNSDHNNRCEYIDMRDPEDGDECVEAFNHLYERQVNSRYLRYQSKRRNSRYFLYYGGSWFPKGCSVAGRFNFWDYSLVSQTDILYWNPYEPQMPLEDRLKYFSNRISARAKICIEKTIVPAKKLPVQFAVQKNISLIKTISACEPGTREVDHLQCVDCDAGKQSSVAYSECGGPFDYCGKTQVEYLPVYQDGCHYEEMCVPLESSFTCECWSNVSGSSCKHHDICNKNEYFTGGIDDIYNSSFCEPCPPYSTPSEEDNTMCTPRTPCDYNACLNDGVCTATSMEDWSCNCPHPFSGRRCEKGPGEQCKCLNGGKCEMGQCVCADGYLGNICEYTIECENNQVFDGQGCLDVCVPGEFSELALCMCNGNKCGGMCVDGICYEKCEVYQSNANGACAWSGGLCDAPNYFYKDDHSEICDQFIIPGCASENRYATVHDETLCADPCEEGYVRDLLTLECKPVCGTGEEFLNGLCVEKVCDEGMYMEDGICWLYTPCFPGTGSTVHNKTRDTVCSQVCEDNQYTSLTTYMCTNYTVITECSGYVLLDTTRGADHACFDDAGCVGFNEYQVGTSCVKCDGIVENIDGVLVCSPTPACPNSDEYVTYVLRTYTGYQNRTLGGRGVECVSRSQCSGVSVILDDPDADTVCVNASVPQCVGTASNIRVGYANYNLLASKGILTEYNAEVALKNCPHGTKFRSHHGNGVVSSSTTSANETISEPGTYAFYLSQVKLSDSVCFTQDFLKDPSFFCEYVTDDGDYEQVCVTEIISCSCSCMYGNCVNGNCQCIDGWGGLDCSEKVYCSDSCVHGTCASPLSHCECDEGWEGDDCASSIDDCNEYICGMGMCSDAHMSVTCECMFGWGPEWRSNRYEQRCNEGSFEHLCLEDDLSSIPPLKHVASNMVSLTQTNYGRTAPLAYFDRTCYPGTCLNEEDMYVDDDGVFIMCNCTSPAGVRWSGQFCKDEPSCGRGSTLMYNPALVADFEQNLGAYPKSALFFEGKCELCPVGKYWVEDIVEDDRVFDTQCVDCPHGKQTAYRGATDESSCFPLVCSEEHSNGLTDDGCDCHAGYHTAGCHECVTRAVVSDSHVCAGGEEACDLGLTGTECNSTLETRDGAANWKLKCTDSSLLCTSGKLEMNGTEYNAPMCGGDRMTDCICKTDSGSGMYVHPLLQFGRLCVVDSNIGVNYGSGMVYAWDDAKRLSIYKERNSENILDSVNRAMAFLSVEHRHNTNLSSVMYNFFLTPAWNTSSDEALVEKKIELLHAVLSKGHLFHWTREQRIKSGICNILQRDDDCLRSEEKWLFTSRLGNSTRSWNGAECDIRMQPDDDNTVIVGGLSRPGESVTVCVGSKRVKFALLAIDNSFKRQIGVSTFNLIYVGGYMANNISAWGNDPNFNASSSWSVEKTYTTGDRLSFAGRIFVLGGVIESYHSPCRSGCPGNETCVVDVDGDIICKSPCSSHPCSKNAEECIVTGNNTFECTCLPGFIGDLCETDVDECLNDPCGVGECFNVPGDYVCNCPEGYQGLHYCMEIDKCVLGNIDKYRVPDTIGVPHVLHDHYLDWRDGFFIPNTLKIKHDSLYYSKVRKRFSPWRMYEMSQYKIDCLLGECIDGECVCDARRISVAFPIEIQPAAYTHDINYDTLGNATVLQPDKDGVVRRNLSVCVTSQSYSPCSGDDVCSNSKRGRGDCVYNDETLSSDPSGVDYKCINCKQGWEGKTCETRIDYCALNHTRFDGNVGHHVCANANSLGCENNYEVYLPFCRCKIGYSGVACEEYADGCAENDCKYGKCESEILYGIGMPYASYDLFVQDWDNNGNSFSDIHEGKTFGDDAWSVRTFYSCDCYYSANIVQDSLCTALEDKCTKGSPKDFRSSFPYVMTTNTGTRILNHYRYYDNVCGYGGECVNNPSSFTCLCPEGYQNNVDSGRCEPINPCDENPCLNAGVCQMIIENADYAIPDYTCTCARGFSGRSCEECALDRGYTIVAELMGIEVGECLPCPVGKYSDSTSWNAPCADVLCSNDGFLLGNTCKWDTPVGCCPPHTGIRYRHPDTGLTLIDESKSCVDSELYDACQECPDGYDNANMSLDCEPIDYCNLTNTDGERYVCYQDLFPDSELEFKCVTLSEEDESDVPVDMRRTYRCECPDEIPCDVSYCPPGRYGDTCLDIDDCQRYEDENGVAPCGGHGACVDDGGGRQTFTCACNEGFAGDGCSVSTICDTVDCGHGFCHPTLDGVDYECQCEAGWEGYSCDVKIDDCQFANCQNGWCVDLGKGITACVCHPGWYGVNCTETVDACDEEKCQGTCVHGICECQLGMVGLNCETNWDDCNPDPCVRGECMDLLDNFYCTCEDGFTGKRCDECEPGHGFFNHECVECPEGKFNTLTTYDEPCVDQSCPVGQEVAHNADWSIIGDNCVDCMSGMESPNGEGVCSNINECLRDPPCANGALCLDLNPRLSSGKKYKCHCTPGYVGEHCLVDFDDCASSPCVAGDCVDLVNDYRCECPHGYEGKNCETFANPCDPDLSVSVVEVSLRDGEIELNGDIVLKDGSMYMQRGRLYTFRNIDEESEDEYGFFTDSSTWESNSRFFNGVSISTSTTTVNEYSELGRGWFCDRGSYKFHSANLAGCENACDTYKLHNRECTAFVYESNIYRPDKESNRCWTCHGGGLIPYSPDKVAYVRSSLNYVKPEVTISVDSDTPKTLYFGSLTKREIPKLKIASGTFPCLNDGVCEGAPGTFACTCANGYYGQRCEFEI